MRLFILHPHLSGMRPRRRKGECFRRLVRFVRRLPAIGLPRISVLLRINSPVLPVSLLALALLALPLCPPGPCAHACCPHSSGSCVSSNLNTAALCTRVDAERAAPQRSRAGDSAMVLPVVPTLPATVLQLASGPQSALSWLS